jgi:hypothetical protein
MLGKVAHLHAKSDGEHEARANDDDSPEAEERKMRKPQHPCEGAVKRCPICGGRFGLIRHYSWRTALCSTRCVDRFRARQETDRNWLSGLRGLTALASPTASC